MLLGSSCVGVVLHAWVVGGWVAAAADYDRNGVALLVAEGGDEFAVRRDLPHYRPDVLRSHRLFDRTKDTDSYRWNATKAREERPLAKERQ